MKNTLVILIIACMIPLGWVQAQDSGELVIPFSSPSEMGSLKVDIKRGSITVRGTDRRDVLVKYEALEENHSKKAKEKEGLRRIASASLDLEAKESNNLINIDSDSWNKGLNLTIEVPKKINLDLDTYNAGVIDVDNIEGEVILENYNRVPLKIRTFNITRKSVL